MAKRKRVKRTKSEYINVDSTLKKLTTQLVDPRVQSWLWQGSQGVRERILQLDFNTLRRTTQRLPLVNAIINARTDQVLPFAQYADEDGIRGFRFVLEDRSPEFKTEKVDEDEIKELTTFIEQTGFLYDPDREDDFADYLSMMVRDIYEIDQIATEIQYNRAGEAVAFWALDGATIYRTTDEELFNKGIRFVQRIEMDTYAEFTPENLLFDYRFKRSDIRYRGYGYSPVEQCVDIITTLLFGYQYIRDQLIKDKVPKGFISVMGDVGKPQLDSIRNYWYAAMAGAGGQWALPILPSGKDGIGVEFKTLNTSNKDMEYHKTMMFVSTLVAAVFGMDLAELGIRTDDSTALIGENMEPRIQLSRDRGLGSVLSFAEQHINKVIRKITQKYRFKFIGLEREDEMQKADIRTKQIAGWRTINEVREEDGLEPFKEDWADMPMNVHVVQIHNAAQSQKQQEAMMAGGGGYGMPGGPEGDGYDEGGEAEGGFDFGSVADEGPEMDFGDMEKSRKAFRELTKAKERTVRVVIE